MTVPAISRLAAGALPGQAETIPAHAPAFYPAFGLLVGEFDLWRQGYAGSVVTVFQAGSTQLAPVYTDPQMTRPAANPQVLLSKTDGRGNTYGKFQVSLYTPVPYVLDIDGSAQTGIERPPLVSLDGQDGSAAFVTRTGGVLARKLADRAADLVVALDYGPISASTQSAAANTQTIQTAIGAASANGGGSVLLPAGVIPFNQLSLPTSVVLAGQGTSATTLTSVATQTVVKGTGDGCGLADLTLDGLTLIAGSVGLGGTALKGVTLTRVVIKRFATGLQLRGGSDHVYDQLTVTNCTVNAALLGDSAAAAGGGGDQFTRLLWRGGELSLSTDTALDLSMIDRPVTHCVLDGVRIVNNTGPDGAVLIGTRFCLFRDCRWDTNVCHLRVADHPDTTLANRQTVSLRLAGGAMTGANGVAKFDGLCSDVVLDAVELSSVNVQLNLPLTPILAEDCFETGTSLTGDPTKFERLTRDQKGTVFGVTTTGATTTAWQRTLNPNEVVMLTCTATAEQVNGADFAGFKIAQAARGAPLTLNFVNLGTAFTAGNTIQGQTSGATAKVATYAASGSSGTLTLGSVAGSFTPGEIIKETNGSGQASVNGLAVPGNAQLVGAAATIYAGRSSANANPWGVSFAVVGALVQVQLTGAAGVTLDWSLNVDVTSLSG